MSRLKYSSLAGIGLYPLHGRHVPGQLEHAPEEHRHVLDGDAGTGLDARDLRMGDVGVGTSEIEQELGLHSLSSRNGCVSVCTAGTNNSAVQMAMMGVSRLSNSMLFTDTP